MDIRAEDISRIIRDQIGNYAVDVDMAEVGTVVSIGDGIARVHGIERAMAGEMIEFPHGVFGIALNLEEESVGTVLLGEYREIKEGDTVKRTGRIISVPVGEEMLGRVVNALGQPIDGKGPIAASKYLPIERLAPGVVDRQPVRDPRAAVVSQHVETVEAERPHKHKHVLRHRALGIVGVVGRAGRHHDERAVRPIPRARERTAHDAAARPHEDGALAGREDRAAHGRRRARLGETARRQLPGLSRCPRHRGGGQQFVRLQHPRRHLHHRRPL